MSCGCQHPPVKHRHPPQWFVRRAPENRGSIASYAQSTAESPVCGQIASLILAPVALGWLPAASDTLPSTSPVPYLPKILVLWAEWKPYKVPVCRHIL